MASADFSPTPSAATTPTGHLFEKKVEEVKVSKSDINMLVMDYLVTNGYPSAASKFAMEANIQPTADISSIQERVNILQAIYVGDIQTAIEKINELNPQILDSNPSLHFALLQLQLVELIRECTSTPDGDVTPALDFATSHLAPRAPTNPQFLEDLERTLSLLIFPSESLSSSPLAGLLDPDLRKNIANRVNEAILQSQGARRDAKLRHLVQVWAWAEQKAREAKKDIPDKLDIGLGQDNDRNSNEASVTQSHSDNADDVVMQEQGDLDPMIS
ncbi:hypothetical protein VTO42DRAFT_8816 [Malbranchea cinnamomea]